MPVAYERDLDLNLLRVFVVVGEEGSVTGAAARLYLTQPAVSAALRRLADAVGEPLFSRQGRGLAFTARGRALYAAARPALAALVEAAASPPAFDPATTDRTVRLGLSDTTSTWLLPALLRELRAAAPSLRIVELPVQFRTVGEALALRRIDLAVTVADDVPAGVRRETLFRGAFVLLYDPAYHRFGATPDRDAYLAADHVIVSYNGDLRGIIEDVYGVERRVRCSVSSFHAVPALVSGSALVGTVPLHVAAQALAHHPHLATAPVPFPLTGAPMELLLGPGTDGDPAVAFVAGLVRRIGGEAPGGVPYSSA